MPFSDELIKCDGCGQMVMWQVVTREGSHKWCPKCAEVRKNVGECKNCEHYNNGDGEAICDFCDPPFTNFYKEKANEEN